MELEKPVQVERDEEDCLVSVRYHIHPQPKQVEFFQAVAPVVAYGGARGGGKSWAARYKAISMCFTYPGFRALILRRTNAELQANHIRPILEDFSELLAAGGRMDELDSGMALLCYNREDRLLHFQNGSLLAFGYCANDDDTARYQGQEYDFVIIDEATQFTEYQFHKLTEICRGANPYPKRVYLTCNPGGIGHGWVKRLFIDRRYRENERPEDYLFIQATVDDNRILLERDPLYRRRLEALPKELREADLNGSWEVYSGQFFKEFTPAVHVVEPFPLPDKWARFRSLDYGLDMLACYWHAVSPDGSIVTYRELHQPGLLASQAAEQILALTGREEKILCTVAPPDLWSRQKDRGRSIVELFFESGLENILMADNNRVAGWMDLKEWLKVEEGRSRYRIFSTCSHLLEAFHTAQADERNPSDMARTPHLITHSLDAVRYFFRSRPHPDSPAVPKRPVGFGRPLPPEDAYVGYGETL